MNNKLPCHLLFVSQRSIFDATHSMGLLHLKNVDRSGHALAAIHGSIFEIHYAYIYPHFL